MSKYNTSGSAISRRYRVFQVFAADEYGIDFKKVLSHYREHVANHFLNKKYIQLLTYDNEMKDHAYCRYIFSLHVMVDSHEKHVETWMKEADEFLSTLMSTQFLRFEEDTTGYHYEDGVSFTEDVKVETELNWYPRGIYFQEAEEYQNSHIYG